MSKPANICLKKKAADVRIFFNVQKNLEMFTQKLGVYPGGGGVVYPGCLSRQGQGEAKEAITSGVNFERVPRISVLKMLII